MHLRDITPKHRKLIRDGLSFNIEVDSVADAIALAEQFRDEGTCDLFRGQTNANWEVTSSFERLMPEQREPAELELRRFFGWAGQLAEMQLYFDKPDSLMAIAQHYGLKTQFIDFTTNPKVAAFFACEANSPPAKDQKATIVCLNSTEFDSFWEGVGAAMIKDAGPEVKPPEIIRIDVANLWRLQIQSGCFLWNPVFGIERIFNFDRIVLPFSSDQTSLPNRELIYPENQSPLEHALTRFFMNEQMRDGDAWIKTIPGIKRFEVLVPKSQYDVTSWHSPGIQKAADWEAAAQWQAVPHEDAREALAGPPLKISDGQHIDHLATELLTIFNEPFIANRRAHVLRVEWVDEVPINGPAHRLIVYIRRLWNGMRRLPFTEHEIRRSLEVLINLFLSGKRDSMTGRVEDLGPESLGPDPLYVEMASGSDGRGDYSRGYVSGNRLIQAHNPKFLEAASEYRGSDGLDPAALLMLLARPWERFTFHGLKGLMIEELIPSQVVLRADAERDEALRTTIYFSPTEFKVFGLA
jgi:hypothetical protein